MRQLDHKIIYNKNIERDIYVTINSSISLSITLSYMFSEKGFNKYFKF